MATPDLTRLLNDYVLAQPNRALGGVRALSGFEYQIRSYLADFAQALASGDGLEPDGESLIRFLPLCSRSIAERSLSLFPAVRFLSRSSCNQLHAFRDHLLFTVCNQQMDVVGGNGIVENFHKKWAF